LLYDLVLPREDSSSEESSSSSGLSILGGRSYGPTTNTQSAHLESSRSRRGTSSRFPDNRTGNPQDRAQAAEPDRTPQFANPSQPGDEPGTEKPRHPSKAPRRDAV
ncbi:MAG: hypothetical protein ICV34_00510, partial [Rubrobacter sp.]|nr:hypothetical protein [Rubrobacter sp.]